MRYLTCLILITFLSCESYTKTDIEGLWQLEELLVDAYDTDFNTTFIKVHLNGSFSVSRRTGDLSGLYKLNSNKLVLSSNDNGWFNNTWSIFSVEDLLVLRGKDPIGRNLKLKFKKTDRIPDYQEFENRILGQWQIYKVKNGSNIEKPKKTFLEIGPDGDFKIVESGKLIETGKATINARHRKIIFENEGMIWNAWFYGQELRLNHESVGIEYSLKRL